MVFRGGIKLSGSILALLCLSAPAYSQSATVPRDQDQAIASVAMEDLPDAPSAFMAMPAFDPDDAPQAFARTKPAKKYHRVVQPDEIAPLLTGGDKLKLAIMSRATVGDIFSTALSAGISQWRDGRPHFGVDSGAFGERLGGIALKQTTQSIFSYGLYAAAFHDDPRYYVMGDGHKPLHRALYSATRLVITKKDDGSSAVNWPKFAGVVSAAALSNAYYPQRDRGVLNTTYSIVSSLGTSVINNELHEFIGDAIKVIHHRK